MAVFKSKIKETTEDKLQRAINLGREETLKEVLEWLDYKFWNGDGEPVEYIESDFESKEQMLQSFKERFNIE